MYVCEQVGRIEYYICIDYSSNKKWMKKSRDGLVGYDAGFTHLRSGVQLPLFVLLFL